MNILNGTVWKTPRIYLGARKRERAKEKESVTLDEEKIEKNIADDQAQTAQVEQRIDTDQDPEVEKKKRRKNIGEVVICRPLEIVVRDGRVEQAIRQLKNRMAREGVLRELKSRRHYFKPSELKRIKRREAARRRRKQARKNSRK